MSQNRLLLLNRSQHHRRWEMPLDTALRSSSWARWNWFARQIAKMLRSSAGLRCYAHVEFNLLFMLCSACARGAVCAFAVPVAPGEGNSSPRMSRKSKQPIDAPLLKVALKDARPGHGDRQKNLTIVADLRQIPEPATMQEGLHHGLRPALLKGFADSDRKRRLLQRICDNMRRGLHGGLRNSKSSLRIKKRRFASQALGKLIAAIALTKPLALVSVAILNLGDDIRRQPCDKCEFRDRRWVIENNAVAAMKHKWHLSMSGQRVAEP